MKNNKKKNQVTECKLIFAIYISYKRLVFRLYKEHSYLNNTKPTVLQAKSSTVTSPKKDANDQ